jgi:hypothetical protein
MNARGTWGSNERVSWSPLKITLGVAELKIASSVCEHALRLTLKSFDLLLDELELAAPERWKTRGRA